MEIPNLTYIVDANQNKKAVVIPLEEWQAILEDLQDYYDVKEASEILKRIEAEKKKTEEVYYGTKPD